MRRPKWTAAELRKLAGKQPLKPKTARKVVIGPSSMAQVFMAACAKHYIPPPVEELRVVTHRDWMFDFAWPETRVALEIEGGIYGRGKACPVCGRRPPGAHSSIERLKSDMEKYNTAAMAGWCVIRCTPEEITTGAVFAFLVPAIEKRMPPE